MKRKIFLITFCFFLFLFPISVFSIEENLTKTATTSSQSSPEGKVNQAIKNLKEKIATKVAELSKKNKRTITGLVKNKEEKNLQILFENKNYSINTDDLMTKFYQITGNSQKEITLKEINKDDYLIILGSEIDNLINADFIYKQEQYLVETGKITEINKNDYSVSVITNNKIEYILDVELKTKQLMMDIKTFQALTTGFSKLKIGDNIHFISYQPKTKTNRVSLIRYLIIPQEYFLMPETTKSAK